MNDDPEDELESKFDREFQELMREYETFASSEIPAQLRAQRIEDAKQLRAEIAEGLKEMYRDTDVDEAFSEAEAYLVERGESSPTDWGIHVGRRLYSQMIYIIQLHMLNLIISGQNPPSYWAFDNDVFVGLVQTRSSYAKNRREDSSAHG